MDLEYFVYYADFLICIIIYGVSSQHTLELWTMVHIQIHLKHT